MLAAAVVVTGGVLVAQDADCGKVGVGALATER